MLQIAAPDRRNLDSLTEMRRRCSQLAIVGLAFVAIAIRHLQNDGATLCHSTITENDNTLMKEEELLAWCSREHFHDSMPPSWTNEKSRTSMNTSSFIAWQNVSCSKIQRHKKKCEGPFL